MNREGAETYLRLLAEAEMREVLSSRAPDRHVPVGRTLPSHDDMVSGELDLISFSHTARGARFTVSWRIRNLLGPSPAEWPFFQFIARDDRGHRYRPDFEMVGPPEWVCYLSLAPEPPRDIRWLDVTTAGRGGRPHQPGAGTAP